MQLARTHYPVTVLGWGVRAAIWTQGCSIHCPACVARDTWAVLPQNEVPAERILAWLESLPPSDGLTISGGEPLDQAGALLDLLRLVRDVQPEGYDILCYTGRTAGEARTHWPELFELVDVLATGPFEVESPKTHPLLGSANQELVLLTELANQRYGDAAALTGGLQATVLGGELFMVGVPGRGDLEAIRRDAAGRGVILDQPSWAE